MTFIKQLIVMTSYFYANYDQQCQRRRSLGTKSYLSILLAQSFFSGRKVQYVLFSTSEKLCEKFHGDRFNGQNEKHLSTPQMSTPTKKIQNKRI